MQQAHSRLLLRARPEPGESLMGYLTRVAGMNGYDDPKRLLSTAGLRNYEIHRARPHFAFARSGELEGLRRLLGLQRPELLAMLYPPEGAAGRGIGAHMFCGSPVPRDVIHPESPKVCPGCLMESRYCRRVWDFKLVTCCPVHGCLLADECPGCGNRIKWHRPAVTACGCGFDLRAIRATPAAGPAARLSGMFYRLCGLSGGPEAEDLSKLGPLAGLRLEHAVAAVLFVAGRLRHVGGVTMAGRGLSGLRNRGAHELLLGAASIFEGWPGRFYDFIESKRSCHGRPSGRILRQQFGEFYKTLFWNARLSHHDLDFFRQALAEYLSLRGEGYFVRRVKVRLTYISLTRAAGRLGVTKERVERFISEEKLRAVRSEGQGGRLFVQAAGVEKLRAELGRQVELRGAAQLLGVSPGVVNRLVNAGRLIPASGRKADGSGRLRFDRDALCRFTEGVPDDLPLFGILFERRPDAGVAGQRAVLDNARRSVKLRAVAAGKLYAGKRPHRKRAAPMSETPYLSFGGECR